jgi:hypothetical protein
MHCSVSVYVTVSAEHATRYKMQQAFLIYSLFYNFHIYSHMLCRTPLLVAANMAIFLGFNMYLEFALNPYFGGYKQLSL